MTETKAKKKNDTKSKSKTKNKSATPTLDKLFGKAKTKVEETPEQKEQRIKVIQEEQAKELLKQEAKKKELESYSTTGINYVTGQFFLTSDHIKAHNKVLLNHGKNLSEFQLEEFKKNPPKIFYLAHTNDTLKGKPQLMYPTKQSLILMKEVIQFDKKSEKYTLKYFFPDENSDKRYTGYQNRTLSIDGYLYKVTDQISNKDFFIYSAIRLGNETYEFKGMHIQIDDCAELNRNLKVKTLSNIFLLQSARPTAQILTKTQIIDLTKELLEQIGIGYIEFRNAIGFHEEYGTISRFSNELELLRIAQLLSGKIHGYPLHLCIMGSAGSRKTVGIIETNKQKFKEEVVEGANSTMKGLVPSFGSRIPTSGHITTCIRLSQVDELGKLILKERNRHESTEIQNNVLGDLNFLLEHKERLVGSGNNSTIIKATAKCVFTMNPLPDRPSLNQHIGPIDPTTMSRMVWYIQTQEEYDFVLEKGIEQLPPRVSQDYPEAKCQISPQTITSLYSDNWIMEQNKEEITTNNKNISTEKSRGKSIVLSLSGGNSGNCNPFLTIYDTCNSFVCDVDLKEVKKLVNEVTSHLTSDKLKNIWQPRADHHVILLVDGLVKYRCLFKDYDSSFTPKNEDYDLAKTILNKMASSWQNTIFMNGAD